MGTGVVGAVVSIKMLLLIEMAEGCSLLEQENIDTAISARTEIKRSDKSIDFFMEPQCEVVRLKSYKGKNLAFT